MVIWTGCGLVCAGGVVSGPDVAYSLVRTGRIETIFVGVMPRMVLLTDSIAEDMVCDMCTGI